MEKLRDSEIRLAELIWRTVKLRVTLLTLSIVVLLIVWSSLLNGNQEAQKIDADFCQSLVNQHNDFQNELTAQINADQSNIKTQPLIISLEDTCQGTLSRSWIQAVRTTDEIMPPDTIVNGLPDSSAKKIYLNRPKAFADYDVRRHATFRLQIQLSSEFSGSMIIVNALSVAEIVPFGVLVVLTVVMILGFQQASYKTQLGSLLAEVDRDRPLMIAQTQFFAAQFSREDSTFKRHFVLSPENIATWTLCGALVLLLVAVISTFILNLPHLIDSTIFSYPFALYSSVVVLSYVLVVTRNSYFESSRRKEGDHAEHNAFELSRNVKWLMVFLVASALISLSLPWATSSVSDDFRGYSFVLAQHPTGKLFHYVTYEIDPRVFREMRLQVITAIAFILACGLYPFLNSRVPNKIVILFQKARTLLAIGVLFLSLNFLIYVGILEYESAFPTPWLDLNAYQGETNAKGASMMFYDPSYGFWLFLVCCWILIWISLRLWPVDRFEGQIR